LLPFVRTVLIRRGRSSGFSQKQFDYRTLRQSSALTNVQRLEIDDLDIPSFMPKLQKYFRPFLPTVRSLRLKEPKGSNRQIIFFIGLFQNLENLSLCQQGPSSGVPEDQTLTPSCTPPLQGRLAVLNWAVAGLFKDMVQLFGQINFSVMNLFAVEETKYLLRACAKTLEVLQLHPNDPLGEQW
jgi:hypothetical protein